MLKAACWAAFLMVTAIEGSRLHLYLWRDNMKTITLCLVATMSMMLAACKDDTDKHAGRALTNVMPPLAQKNGCNNCHDIDQRVVGPSWMDVSRKYRGAAKYTYRGQEYPLEDGLVLKVSQGGAGNWGSMPMPGNDLENAKQAEIRELVKFVLALGKP